MTMIVLLMISFTRFQLDAQDGAVVKKEDLSKRLQKLFDEGVQQLKLGYLDEGLGSMNRILDKEPDCIDCLIQIASIHFDMRKYWLAIPPLESILSLDPEYRPMAWVIYGESLFFMERYGEAQVALKEYISAGHKEGKWTKQARKVLFHAEYAEKAMQTPVELKIFPVTANITSDEMEYHPSLTADGKTLVFTRKIDGQEDLMVSYWQGTEWSPATPMESINTRRNEGAHCISADGRTIVFTSCDKRQGIGSCDLYISQWTGENWTVPVNMGPEVNSTAWESMPSLSANGEWLYFSSNRRGGHGGTDIWITRRSVDGGWLTPFNAGPVINTTSNEESPFLHQDGRTLYFMSEGHPGFGGQDLFFSRKNERHEWSTPKNLGYPINTSSQEGGINVALGGGEAYMFTDRPGPDRTDANSTGDFDIIAIELPEAVKPLPATYLKLTVLDRSSRQPVSAMINIQSLPSNELYNRGKADKEGGYLICLPSGNMYLINIEAPGYVIYSDKVTLINNATVLEPISKEVFLTPVEEEISITRPRETIFNLQNIFFATGSDSLMETSRFEIKRLANFMKNNSGLRIEIRGHTDNVGSEEDNLRLSEGRAKAVYQALVREGISPERMQFRGFGESKPVATNDTDEGRSKNRRTEFVILTE